MTTSLALIQEGYLIPLHYSYYNIFISLCQELFWNFL